MSPSPKRPSLIAGIDPGLSGAICLIEAPRKNHTHLRIHELIDIPLQYINDQSDRKTIDLKRLANDLSFYRDQIDYAVIEHVHSMPGQGVASTFAFGKATGQLEGLIASSFIPFFSVAPQVWKAALRIPKDKAESIRAAVKLFPDDYDRFCRAKDHNRAEAALIAVYGALYLQEEFKALRHTIRE